KEMMARITGTRIFGDGSIYWAVPYFLALSVSGLFLLWTCRRSWGSVTSLFLAGGFYATAVAAQMELIFRGMGGVGGWVEESCEMMGDFCILMTITLYARRLAQEMESKRSQQHRETWGRWDMETRNGEYVPARPHIDKERQSALPR